MKPTRCEKCPADVVFTQMIRKDGSFGKLAPIDVTPEEKGNVRLSETTAGMQGRVLAGQELARRRLAAADALIEERSAQVRRLQDLVHELSVHRLAMEEQLRPAVERIAGVRYGDRWYFCDPREHAKYFEAEERFLQAPSAKSIDTTHRAIVEYRVADEVLALLLADGGRLAEDFFVHVGTLMLKRLVAETKKRHAEATG